MQQRHWIPAVLIGISLLVAGCGGESGNEAASEPATVEEVAGQTRVILTPEAARRLDIRTTPVRRGAGEETVIPFAAVLYDPNGETWTYTSPKPLVYVRKDISVERIEGDRAILKAGPPSGTPVVTVGATEIWGVEYGGIEED
jgi:hypothetical protein